jgi:hypothetical protein
VSTSAFSSLPDGICPISLADGNKRQINICEVNFCLIHLYSISLNILFFKPMKKNSFLFELIKSPPFLMFIILALLIIMGVLIANHHDKVVKMKENILYIAPKPGK